LQSRTPVLVLRACQATRAYGLDILRGHSGALAQASVCLRRRATTCVYDRCVAEFVPPDFEVPCGLQTSEFLLEPLGPEHNEQDYAAWTSSMKHIAGTPGYPDGSWPREHLDTTESGTAVPN
jgi:hypothetical protein